MRRLDPHDLAPPLEGGDHGHPTTGADMTATDADPVGAPEIAARLGVKRQTVDQWRQRSLGFPQPRWTVGGRPAWDWPDVEAWHRGRGA